ncbi:hypothetical protein GCM10025881_35480 [Pseudolysinimonas kribbensis]|uniref:Uncharacterized protein n=1 Tax=Pseudolysinimonas kribbensis TaxID=433641 RepID=A0ABQ6KDA2_9MICO|nr:hypothetical protein GCM10025881_35480 [Pseudolysinimonas kribbensis]
MAEQVLGHAERERELQEGVDDGRDGDRADDRERHVALRVARLAGQLDALPEPAVGEDDARGRDRDEDAPDPSGANPWLVKFAGLPMLVVPSAVMRKTTMMSAMIASFHHTSTLFTRANSLTPK